MVGDAQEMRRRLQGIAQEIAQRCATYYYEHAAVRFTVLRSTLIDRLRDLAARVRGVCVARALPRVVVLRTWS